MKLYGNWVKDEEDGSYYNLDFVKRISIQQSYSIDKISVTIHTINEVETSIEYYSTLEEAQEAIDELFEELKIQKKEIWE